MKIRHSLLPVLMLLNLASVELKADTEPGIQQSSLVGLSGVLVDSITGQPIPAVTVQALNTGRATLANELGQFRLLIEKGSVIIKFSHVGYHSKEIEISLTSATDLGEIALTPAIHLISGIRVFEKAYDPAQRIIAEAIRRKSEILSRITNYRNDAYVKMVIRDQGNTDSSKIWGIVESQTTAYWQSPDQYKEVLNSRRSTANLASDGNFVAVGEFLNFNKNRIFLGDYQLVSPTANDALEFYEYYLIDTLLIDSTKVWVLELEPKSQDIPLFAGSIHIVDSTFDVVYVDVGFNEAARIPMLSELRYRQRMAKFENEYWVPIDIRFFGQVNFDIPLPGVPKTLAFEYLASLHDFVFDQPFEPGTFDDYEFEILETADDFDSVAWQSNQMVPLTEEETGAYVRFDSLEARPKSWSGWLLSQFGKAAGNMLGGSSDAFHFNRVEGTYFGLGFRSRELVKRCITWGSSGYSHELADWQGEIGFDYRVSQKPQIRVYAELKDRIAHGTSLTNDFQYNSSLAALLDKKDPHDYYREKGFRGGVSLRPFRHTTLALGFQSYNQSSVTTNTDYSLFNKKGVSRVNPPAAAGRLRSFTARLSLDSRKLINFKGWASPGFASNYATLDARVEVSSPDLGSSDFHFKRYHFSIFARVRPYGSSATTIRAELGLSDYQLPPQRFFAVDYGNGLLLSERGFNTVGDQPFYGDRAFTAYVVHDLGRNLWKASRMPLLSRLPFGLSVHGGAFWTDFSSRAVVPSANQHTALAAYSELGFSLYNLTPFISPFNLSVGFTWQLSDYDTNDYNVHLGLKL